jgi:hypothetical protein
MQNLHDLDMSDLIDLLAQQTVDYTRMLSGGASDVEFATCALNIRNLQREILSRRQSPDNTSASEGEIIFTDDELSTSGENTNFSGQDNTLTSGDAASATNDPGLNLTTNGSSEDSNAQDVADSNNGLK